MNEALDFVTMQRMERTAVALRRNRMQATCVAHAAEARALVRQLLQPGDSIAVGGSMSLQEADILPLLQEKTYRFIDRDAAKTPEERTALMREAFFADCYLASANAVTENGEIYEVDGNANRIAALAYGPQRVILVVGCNKIVPDLEAAKRRVASIAAPANAKRLACKTPCAVTGKCEDCHSPARICCSTLILGPQRSEGRIHVILVGEALGY